MHACVRTSARFWVAADSCQVPGACRQQVYQKHVCHFCCTRPASRWHLPAPPTHSIHSIHSTHSASHYVKRVCVWELLLCSPIWSLFETTCIAPSLTFIPQRRWALCHFHLHFRRPAFPLSAFGRKSIVVCNKRKANGTKRCQPVFAAEPKSVFSLHKPSLTQKSWQNHGFLFPSCC